MAKTIMTARKACAVRSETRVNPEYYRNIASASVQLLCGLAILPLGCRDLALHLALPEM